MKSLSNLLKASSEAVPLPVSFGGTGTALISGLIKGNGTGAFSAAQSGTDFISPSGGTVTGLLAVKELTLTKTAPAISSNILTIDCSLGNFFAVALTSNITSFTISNIPTSSNYFEFALELTAAGTARTVTWSFSTVAVKWPSGALPTLTSTNGKKDTFVFYTYDAGATWNGFTAGQNL